MVKTEAGLAKSGNFSFVFFERLSWREIFMFGSATLEIAIGLAFVYLLFSLVCTTLTESIGRLFRLRASTLKGAIANMIVGEGDESVPGATKAAPKSSQAKPPKTAQELQEEYVDKGLYQHGLIQSLAKSSWYDRLLGGRGLDTGRPSYIPARIFTLALLDSIVNKSVTPATPDTKSTTETPYLERLKVAIQKLPAGLPVRSVLQSFVEQSRSKAKGDESDLAKVQEQVEEWFNDVMERTSGWYTRKTSGIVFGLAIIITFAFNIDTLAIANSLARDATLRTTVVNAADKFFVANSPPQSTVQLDVPPSGPITDTLTNTVTSSITASTVPASSIAASPAITLTLNELEKEIEGLGLPLGWVRMQGLGSTAGLFSLFVTDIITETKAVTITAKAQYEQAQKNRQTWPARGGDWGKKFAGFFLTIVALSLGAPFWFDLLGKLVNLRSTGKPPKEPNPPAQDTGRVSGSGWS
ncbi:MAG: hypothetical protein ACOYNY_38350 [Caldilineaceae bacterium]